MIEQRCGAFGESVGRTRLGWCIFGADYKACTGPENVCAVSIGLEPALSARIWRKGVESFRVRLC